MRRTRLYVLCLGLSLPLIAALAIMPGISAAARRQPKQIVTPDSQLIFYERAAGVYVGQGRGLTFEADPRGPILSTPLSRFQIRFAGAGTAVRIEGRQPLAAQANFYYGGRPSDWRAGVPLYSGLAYREAFPGVDVIYSTGGGGLKSDYIVAPGAEPAAIRLRYDGVQGVSLTEDGALSMELSDETIREDAPLAYQDIGSRRVWIPARYRLDADGGVGFEVRQWDRSRPLVIDPGINFSTYLGGSGGEAVTGVAADSAGNVYVTGWTDSTDWSPVNGTAFHRGVDAFVAKYSSAGSLLFITFVGGWNDDRAAGITVDAGGSVYIVGDTNSDDYPTLNAVQRLNKGGGDSFVTRLSPSGALLYSTFLGGTGHEQAGGVAVNSSGQAVIIGTTSSTDFPLVGSIQSIKGSGTDIFVAQVSAGGDALVFSTYLGGNGDDRGLAVAVNSAGNIYGAGDSYSSNFPLAGTWQTTRHGAQDAVIFKLAPGGTALVYSIYYGGSGGSPGAPESATAIAVDGAGRAYVGGITSSTDFPVVNAVRSTFGGGLTDGFLLKLNENGTAAMYATYFGGSSADYVTSVAVDGNAQPYIGGYTSSSDIPVSNAVQSTNAGIYDGFFAQLNPAGNTILQSSYLGGSGSDAVLAIAVGSGAAVYLGGQTSSSNFPVVNAASGTLRGTSGGFLASVPRMGATSAAAVRCGTFRGGTWTLDLNGSYTIDGSDASYRFGNSGDTPVVGDWTGDGRQKIGLFRSGIWLLDLNGNGAWDGAGVDRLLYLGRAGDIPVVGDWNGDGRAKIGVFRKGLWILDYNGNGVWDGPTVDRAFYLGQNGDTVVLGDWNGDGRKKVGTFRDGVWMLDYNGNGRWDGNGTDLQISFGIYGDVPVVGDWNGNGRTKIGVFRSGRWVLDYNGNFVWDGTVNDRYYSFGAAGDTPLVGDWSGDGIPKIGFYRAGTWYLDYNGNGSWDGTPTDRMLTLGGTAQDIPLVGKW